MSIGTGMTNYFHHSRYWSEGIAGGGLGELALFLRRERICFLRP